MTEKEVSHSRDKKRKEWVKSDVKYKRKISQNIRHFKHHLKNKNFLLLKCRTNKKKTIKKNDWTTISLAIWVKTRAFIEIIIELKMSVKERVKICKNLSWNIS